MKYARISDKNAKVETYIEVDKVYKISEYDGISFVISLDQTRCDCPEEDDEDTFCLVDGCGHIGGAIWELFEELPETNQPKEKVL